MRLGLCLCMWNSFLKCWIIYIYIFFFREKKSRAVFWGFDWLPWVEHGRVGRWDSAGSEVPQLPAGSAPAEEEPKHCPAVQWDGAARPWWWQCRDRAGDRRGDTAEAGRWQQTRGQDPVGDTRYGHSHTCNSAKREETHQSGLWRRRVDVPMPCRLPLLLWEVPRGLPGSPSVGRGQGWEHRPARAGGCRPAPCSFSPRSFPSSPHLLLPAAGGLSLRTIVSQRYLFSK